MAQSESIATAVDNSNWNGFLADDGTTSRVREGQVAIVTAFGNLTVPTNATINGIEFDMEGLVSPGEVRPSKKNAKVIYTMIEKDTFMTWTLMTSILSLTGFIIVLLINSILG